MTKNEKIQLQHLNFIADFLISHGYRVEQPKADDELLDVWGFETISGKSRRRKCFLEIYGTILMDKDGRFVDSYWTVSDFEQDVHVVHDIHTDRFGGLHDLLEAIGSVIEPLKRKAA